ncbi:MAG: hypothetical protein BTN85_0797 [Candidatus Methanohalarchaeum thermophilum]|uniref:RiboL-PSP-HEPN domain-containing protein n=1 Tax=Methanohalarchaeum thermophilum TaxID=1903181 RepID=A0A1Q6DVA7_METT1|nr:MAG: hypothetical protein BTN85_0797 [Candidatus Methanohalarchaeum thermophilum]
MNKIASQIDLEKINEDEGSLVFNLKDHNLFSSKNKRIIIFNFKKDNTRFLLEKDKDSNIKYTYLNPKRGLREAKINLKNFQRNSDLFIALTWSKQKNSVSIGELPKRKNNLVQEEAEQKDVKVKKTKDGSLVVLGDEDTEVANVMIKKDSKKILLPEAKEKFDFLIERLEKIIDLLKEEDKFIVESTIVQQSIVSVFAGIESYHKKRIEELTKENLDSFEPVFDKIELRESKRKEVRQKAKNEDKDTMEALSQCTNLNPLNIDTIAKIFEDLFNVNYREIINNGNYRPKIERFNHYRNNIVHKPEDTTILNFDKTPQQDPIHAKLETLIKIKELVEEFINELHKKTID